MGNWLEGIAGAGMGFLSGGPLGAVAGGIGGFTSGNPSQTQRMNLAPMTGNENDTLNMAYQQMQSSMQSMTPEQRAQFIEQAAGTYYAPMAQQINDSYLQALGGNRAAMAVSGQMGSGVHQDTSRRTQYDMANAMGQARATSRQMGEQSFLNMDQNRLQNLAAGQGIFQAMKGAQMGRSGMTSTFNDPNQFGYGMNRMAGYAANNPNSWYNQQGGGGQMASMTAPPVAMNQGAAGYDFFSDPLNQIWG